MNERKSLPDADVAKAGGWSGADTLRRIYQSDTADAVRAAVEFGT